MPTAVGPSTATPEEAPGSSLPSDTSDEIMDLLVQSVTKSSPRALAARERKRSRGNRKSCEYSPYARCPLYSHQPPTTMLCPFSETDVEERPWRRPGAGTGTEQGTWPGGVKALLPGYLSGPQPACKRL